MSEPALSLLQRIRDDKYTVAGVRLVIAVSGGADSMALLHLYTRVRDDYFTNVLVATFNHGLRGQQGSDDTRFVAETARSWGVQCQIGQNSPLSAASGIESRARTARYHFLAKAARDFRASFIVTAHHADDQAETVLLNLIRGAGMRGLGGMRSAALVPDAPDLTLLRPLLGVRRAELEAYCRVNGIVWREDETNQDTRYRRNWVRHAVIPQLATANPAVVEAVTRSAAILQQDDAYLEGEAVRLLAEHATRSDGRVWIPRAVFETWPVVLQRRVLILAAGQVASGAFEPDYQRIQAALMLIGRPEGGEAEQGGGVSVLADSGFITVVRAGSTWSPPHAGFWAGMVMALPTDARTADFTLKLMLPERATIVLRSRRDGDRVFPSGLAGKSQKLKDFLINKKVPRLIRDQLPIVDSNGEIAALWDGATWVFFAPFAAQETVEMALKLQLEKT